MRKSYLIDSVPRVKAIHRFFLTITGKYRSQPNLRHGAGRLRSLKTKFKCLIQFHIGRTQLYEISKQSYGVGIAEHIRNLRIEKAKELLAKAQLPLAEIAEQCGFKDYNNFITVFKKRAGSRRRNI